MGVRRRNAGFGNLPSSEPFSRRAARTVRRMFLFACAAGLAAGGFVAARSVRAFVYQSDYFVIQKIEINGATDALEAEARSLLNEIFRDRGKNLCALNARELAATFCAMPRARGALVRKVYPATLQIDFDERRPLLAVNLGRLYFMDEEGYLLAPATAAEISQARLPVLTGVQDPLLRPGRRVASARVRSILEAARFIQQSDPFLQNKIVGWSIDSHDEITAFLRSRAEVRFGTDAPLKTLDKLSAGLAANHELETKQYIDLRMERQIVYR